MTLATTRVVLAEDNKTVRKGIKRFLNEAADIEVVGEAENGIDAMQLVNELHPDLLLLDVQMPKLSGIEVAKRLRKRRIKTRILVLSAFDDQAYIQAMLANGASGYLIKDEAPERILEAVRGVALGEVGWVSPQVKARLSKKKIKK
jgi:DNA-binding NarL/FixJ family response regulator